MAHHDDRLFLAMLLTGFYALLRLGEMAFPNDIRIHDWRKISRRRTVVVTETTYRFILPFHKADRGPLFQRKRDSDRCWTLES
jgi:hypothetical protein